MNLLLLNIAGLWALAALPLVVGIHLLRRRSHPVWASTLFLLRKARAPSGGRRFAPLRQSLPLWLQLSAVAMLALALAKPVLREKQPFSSLVVVLDQSASMAAFRGQALGKLKEVAERHAGEFQETEWVLLDSEKNKLASGRSAGDLLRAANEVWKPYGSMHDPAPALDFARLLAGPNGRVVYLTDHPPEGERTDWISVGRPIPNIGFSGLKVDPASLEWSALLQNYDTQGHVIEWREVRGETLADPQSVALEPGGGSVLHGRLSSSDDRLELRLESDGFSLDDRLFILCPRIKKLGVALGEGDRFRSAFERIIEAFGNAVIAPPGEADLFLRTAPPGELSISSAPAVVFLDQAAGEGADVSAVFSEDDPLSEGLNWGGLAVGESEPFIPKSGDRVLAWQGDRALIFIREANEGPVLVWNFDVLRSNAMRLPAFAILLHRFASEIRNRKVGFESRLVETGQPLDLAGIPPGRAPGEPGFFERETNEGVLVFSGAANFADTREADFRQAAAYIPKETNAFDREIREEDRPLSGWLLALLGLLLLANWAALGRESSS